MIDVKAEFSSRPNGNDCFFSLCVPTYKQNKRLICECLDSIFHQNFKYFEVLVCQQGDDNINYLKERYPSIKIIHQAIPSLSLARAALWSNALGNYVWFIDSDDRIGRPDALSLIYSRIVSLNNPDVILIGRQIIDEGGNIVRGGQTQFPLPKNKVELNELLLSSDDYNGIVYKVLKRSSALNFPSKDIYQSEDKYISLTLLKNLTTFGSVDLPLYEYRNNLSSMSKAWKKENFSDSCFVIDFIESNFSDQQCRFKGYAYYLSTFSSQVLQGICYYHLKAHDLEDILASYDVARAMTIFKNNKNKIFKYLPLKKRLVCKAIIKKNFNMLRLQSFIFAIKHQKELRMLLSKGSQEKAKKI